MPNCDICGSEMSPLFTSYFCPNDCDVMIENADIVVVFYHFRDKSIIRWEDGVMRVPDNGCGCWYFGKVRGQSKFSTDAYKIMREDVIEDDGKFVTVKAGGPMWKL